LDFCHVWLIWFRPTANGIRERFRPSARQYPAPGTLFAGIGNADVEWELDG
jgi:hypothetical protein